MSQDFKETVRRVREAYAVIAAGGLPVKEWVREGARAYRCVRCQRCDRLELNGPHATKCRK